MGESNSSDPQPDELWMLGPIPPPVTGMTVLTQQMLNAFREAGPVRFLNWSPELPRRTLWMRLKRNWRILQSIGKLAARGRVKGQPLYTVANAGSGLYVTALVVLVASRLGYKIYLHHHVYAYLDRYDWRMAWIDRVLGSRGVHVVHSDQMIDDFRRIYPTHCEFAVVHPSIVPTVIEKPRDMARRPFRLGMLSSLTLAKGLDQTIHTFERLRHGGRDVSLTLAGAVPSAKCRRLIHQAINDHPDRVLHIGPVHGDDKSKFYAEIDAFLFPTMSESWGLVLYEALSAGVPVITYNRGCTATVVGREAGLLIDPNSRFVEFAVAQIISWQENSEEYRRASAAAIEQATWLRDTSQRTLAEFVGTLFPATHRAAELHTPAAANLT